MSEEENFNYDSDSGEELGYESDSSVNSWASFVPNSTRPDNDDDSDVSNDHFSDSIDEVGPSGDGNRRRCGEGALPNNNKTFAEPTTGLSD